MHAGVQAGGANLAWWHLSAEREDAHYAGDNITTSTVDIVKCFDQIVPLLALSLLHLAGMPWSILRAYASMMREVQVGNVLPQGAGVPYKRRCFPPPPLPILHAGHRTAHAAVNPHDTPDAGHAEDAR